MSTGSPPEEKMRLFAIAPTSMPSASAAAAAVGVEPSKISMRGSMPAAERSAATASWLGWSHFA